MSPQTNDIRIPAQVGGLGKALKELAQRLGIKGTDGPFLVEPVLDLGCAKAHQAQNGAAGKQSLGQRVKADIAEQRLVRHNIQEEELWDRTAGTGIVEGIEGQREADLIEKSGKPVQETPRKWCVDINRLNWRKHEPFELAAEQSQWIRRAALRAVGEGLIDQKDAEAMIGETIGGGLALPALERRAFMKLPLDERRRILADQADKMVAHYEQDSEWRAVEAGDIVDY